MLIIIFQSVPQPAIVSLTLLSSGASKTARSRCRWSVSGGRACGTVCECHELVHGASERLVSTRDCSAARIVAAITAHIVLQPAVWPQADGHALLAAGAIETGRAAGEGVFGLARADRPRRHVATRRGAGTMRCQHARTIGHAAMVRRLWTGHALGMFAGRTQRHVARALALGRSSAPGGLRSVLGGWRIEATVGPHWLLAPNRGWSSSWCGVARPSLPSVQVV